MDSLLLILGLICIFIGILGSILPVLPGLPIKLDRFVIIVP